MLSGGRVQVKTQFLYNSGGDLSSNLTEHTKTSRLIWGWWFTFTGFAVWLQSEANRTATAHSSDRVVTRAVTAAVVHRTGLCRETGTHSQTKPVEIHHRCHLGPFSSFPQKGNTCTLVFYQKGRQMKLHNSQHSFFRLMAARNRKQTRVLASQRCWNKEQSQMQQLDEINAK